MSAVKKLRKLPYLLRYWYRDVLRQLIPRLRWRLAGIDTSMVSVDELGLNPDCSRGYACSGGPNLARVFRELGITSEHSIIDIGCGKGGALITMAEFPFRRIAGLELSTKLIQVARYNLMRAGLDRCELIHGDAAEYEDYDDFTHVYFYNPFTSPIMRLVVDRLEASVARSPRDLTIIYDVPSCHDEIVRHGVFSLVRRFDHAGLPFHVYKADPTVARNLYAEHVHATEPSAGSAGGSPSPSG